MDPAHKSPPSSKAMSQREYREEERECFNTLRDVIRGLTGVELRTRQAVPRKAIEILSLELGRQEEARVSAPNYEAHSTNYVHEGASHAVDNSFQLPHFPDNRQPSADFDAPMFYDGAQIHDQQYNMPDMNSGPNQPSFQHGWDLPYQP